MTPKLNLFAGECLIFKKVSLSLALLFRNTLGYLVKLITFLRQPIPLFLLHHTSLQIVTNLGGTELASDSHCKLEPSKVATSSIQLYAFPRKFCTMTRRFLKLCGIMKDSTVI